MTTQNDVGKPDFDWQTFIALGNPKIKQRRGMAYNKFSLEEVVTKFNLRLMNAESVVGHSTPIAPSAWLAQSLKSGVSRALSSGTEKSRSEFIVAPILLELIESQKHKLALFSGTEFSVDKRKGLSGRCDFLINRSEQTPFVTAPVLTIVEAKNDNLNNGLGQCAAEMVAAQIFNERHKRDIKRIFGAVTSGTNWRLMKLEAQNLFIEERERVFDFGRNTDELLGILSAMVETDP